MVEQRTFVMIKPAFMKVKKQITKDIDRACRGRGIRIATRDIDSAPYDEIYQHYFHKRLEIYFPWMMDAMVNKPMRLMVYTGDEIIDFMMEVTGRATDPSLCALNTIRRKYADPNENAARARAEKRMLESVVHRSSFPDDPDKDANYEAEREIKIWQPYLQLNF